MSVGNPLTESNVNQNLTNLAVALRNVCWQIKNLNTQVNGGGNGLALLEALGFSSTANSQNPGSVSDAQYALNLISDLNNIAGCYYGTVQQGGSGGTGAITFNFDNSLAPLWAGQ